MNTCFCITCGLRVPTDAPCACEDWREQYARKVYAPFERPTAPERRDLDNPSPDPDRELNQQRGL